MEETEADSDDHGGPQHLHGPATPPQPPHLGLPDPFLTSPVIRFVGPEFSAGLGRRNVEEQCELGSNRPHFHQAKA